MTPSYDRILTTHTGSLARPKALEAALNRVARGELAPEVVASDVRSAVADVVARQVEVGLDIVNDGEMGKTGFFGYVWQRLSGFDLVDLSSRELGLMPEAMDFPEWGADFQPRLADANQHRSAACVGDVAYVNRGLLEADIANLEAARDACSPLAVFMTAAAPGLITHMTANQHYSSHEEYVGALAEAMKTEYDAIHAAGFVIQFDCPDLASWGRTTYPYPGATFEDWRRVARLNVEALNEATRDIPPEAMRMHVCWGNYAGPHTRDVALREIIDILLHARPAGLSIEAANPRHEHEWSVFEGVKLPEGKILIPGVVDSTTNFVEHPELVAQRIANFARVVGRENVLAGTDCGFATLASWVGVEPRVAFAKLRSLVDGAELASGKLWASGSSTREHGQVVR
jgi:5-methyltetrahydropteroyltriglutamate--homocysteine methyltransferase